MRKVIIALILSITMAIAVSCNSDPIDEKTYYIVTILNETQNPVLWSLVDGNGEPGTFSGMAAGLHSSIVVEEGHTYTLYCYSNLGDKVKYEDGYSYAVTMISQRSQETIDMDSTRCTVRLGYDGSKITYSQEKK